MPILKFEIGGKFRRNFKQPFLGISVNFIWAVNRGIYTLPWKSHGLVTPDKSNRNHITSTENAGSRRGGV